MLPPILSQVVGGLKLTVCTVGTLRSVVWHSGPSCERGIRTPFDRLPWPCQTNSAAMARTDGPCVTQLWLLWVVRRPLLLFLVGRTCWLTLMTTIWRVGTIGGWLSTPLFIWDTWSDVCKKIFFHIWNFGSVFHDQIHCHEGEGSRSWGLDDVKFWSSSCHYHRRAVHAVTSRVCEHPHGCAASHRGLPQGPHGDDNLVVFWIPHFWSNCTFFHMLIVLFCFRRRDSMVPFLSTKLRGANFVCSTRSS